MAENLRRTRVALPSVACAAVLSACLVPDTLWAVSGSAAATEARLGAAQPFMSKALAAKILNGSVTVAGLLGPLLIPVGARQSNAAARFFGGEIKIKNLIANFLRNSCALVMDFGHDRILGQ